ncbi:MAG: InlB B-repeat-containing protein, partial [Bacilli bacterium]|nr:InlB B-repeat-containing protein [Bacilli bacterium]
MRHRDKMLYIFIIVLYLMCFCSCNLNKKESELDKKRNEMYQMALSDGYEGTYEEWLQFIKGEQGSPGKDGRDIELIVEEGMIKWRHIGDAEWHVLIYVEELIGLQGEPGLDGREIVFQINEGFIQWQYEEESTWNNLMELSSIVGPKGEPGKEVVFQVNDGFIQWKYEEESIWNNLIELSSLVGPKGEPGKEVVFQVNNGFIQWKYQGESNWTNLIALSTIIGPIGLNGLSNYEIYLKHYLEYEGNEELWINDLVKGNLYEKEIYNVEFITDCDIEIEPIDVVAGETVTLPLLSCDGFTFLGWYTGFTVNDAHYTNHTPVLNNLVLYAKWQVNQYNIKINTNCDILIPDMVVDYGTPLNIPYNLVREGYTFTDWYMDEEFLYPLAITYMLAYDLSLYAKWEINDYTIEFCTFNDNPLSTLIYQYNSVITLIDEPSKEDYLFYGWHLDEECTIPFKMTYMPAYNIVLYAKWELIPEIVLVPVEGDDYQIIRKFWRYDAPTEDQEMSIIVYGSNYYMSKGVSFSKNNEDFYVIASLSGEVVNVVDSPVLGKTIKIQ